MDPTGKDGHNMLNQSTLTSAKSRSLIIALYTPTVYTGAPTAVMIWVQTHPRWQLTLCGIVNIVVASNMYLYMIHILRRPTIRPS